MVFTLFISKTFHRETKIEKYVKYIDLRSIIIQDYHKTYSLWNVIKNSTADSTEDVIHEMNDELDTEYLISGMIDDEIKQRYLIPIEIIFLIIKYHDGSVREYEEKTKQTDQEKLQTMSSTSFYCSYYHRDYYHR